MVIEFTDMERTAAMLGDMVCAVDGSTLAFLIPPRQRRRVFGIGSRKLFQPYLFLLFNDNGRFVGFTSGETVCGHTTRKGTDERKINH